MGASSCHTSGLVSGPASSSDIRSFLGFRKAFLCKAYFVFARKTPVFARFVGFGSRAGPARGVSGCLTGMSRPQRSSKRPKWQEEQEGEEGGMAALIPRTRKSSDGKPSPRPSGGADSDRAEEEGDRRSLAEEDEEEEAKEEEEEEEPAGGKEAERVEAATHTKKAIGDTTSASGTTGTPAAAVRPPAATGAASSAAGHQASPDVAEKASPSSPAMTAMAAVAAAVQAAAAMAEAQKAKGASPQKDEDRNGSSGAAGAQAGHGDSPRASQALASLVAAAAAAGVNPAMVSQAMMQSQPGEGAGSGMMPVGWAAKGMAVANAMAGLGAHQLALHKWAHMASAPIPVSVPEATSQASVGAQQSAAQSGGISVQYASLATPPIPAASKRPGAPTSPPQPQQPACGKHQDASNSQQVRTQPAVSSELVPLTAREAPPRRPAPGGRGCM